jgi:type IV pilus assembly protein PilC
MFVSWSAPQPSPSAAMVAREQVLNPVWLRLQRNYQGWLQNLQSWRNARKNRGGIRVDRTTLTTMLGSLSTMVEGGVPLYRALHNLATHSEKVEAALLARSMMYDLEKGTRLSKAASKHTASFSPLHVGLLKVGETTGSLTTVLKQLVTFEEKAQATLLKIKSALTYPAIVLFLCAIGLALAPPFLLEPHFQLIRDLGVEAPLLTRMLMAFSALMLTPLPYILGIAAGFGVHAGTQKLLRNRQRRLWITRKLLTVPKFGPMLQTLLVGRFARALAVQMQAGVPILDALHLAGRASGNAVMEDVADQVVSRMLRGAMLSHALKRTGFFSPMFISVVRCGEETGEVAQLIGWLADLNDSELDNSIESVVSMIEPFIMAGVGIVVGTMVLATMLPLSQALDAL